MLQLIGEAKAALEQHAPNKRIFLIPFVNIEAAFQQLSLLQPVTTLKSIVNPTVMVGLAHCAEFLSGKSTETVLSAEFLAGLRADISDLIDQVLASDLHADLKRVIVDQLQSLLSSIIEYRIRGSDGMRKALEASVGALVINHELFKPAKDKKEVSKFWDILARIGKGLDIATRGTRLLESVMNLLPSSQSAS